MKQWLFATLGTAAAVLFVLPMSGRAAGGEPQAFYRPDTPKFPQARTWMAQKAKLPPYKAPRTPDGVPNLQGNWNGPVGGGNDDLEEHEFIDVTTPTGKHPELTVRGTIKDNGGLFAAVTVPRETMRTAFGQRDDAFDFVAFRGGADEKAVRGRVDALLKTQYPSTESKDKGEFKDQQASQINQFATFMYVLLSLAVIVSLFGLVNTLALSIFERQRELGMLRAIGTARSQVRRMIRYEAIVTALIGAALGLVLGTVFARVITTQFDGYVFAVPFGRIVGIAILAGLAGIAAAALPARRAARTNVLEALAYE